MTTVTTEQLQKDFNSVRGLIERGETSSLEEDGIPLGTFRPGAAEHHVTKRVFNPLQGKIKVPDDFDTMMRNEIEAMFYGK